MFLIIKLATPCRFLAVLTLLLTSCQVSEKWAFEQPSHHFSVDHTPSQLAPSPALSHQGPIATVAQPASPIFASAQPIYQPPVSQQPVMQIPVANYRAAVQTTAIRAASVQVPVNPNPTPVSAFSSGPRGKVTLVNGRAVAPADAPAVVRRVVEAGNRLQDKPYKWGGGHAQLNDDGYDCSGAVSYVLREAGLMKGSTTSKGFFTYGESGEGEWITVWTKEGHAFIIVGGLRLDTGGSLRRTGPRWKTKKRSYKNCVARHPKGL